MAYSSIVKPTDYFNTKLYTGDGNSTKAITGVGFQPDWIWIKNRTDAHWHNLTDSVRGTSKTLRSNTNAAEAASSSSGYVSAFGADGFTVSAGSSDAEEVNTNTDTYVSWNWLAGGSASSNSNGSITSSVSANTTAGFSIVSYTGAGGTPTIGHGLGGTPEMIIFKCRETSTDWTTFHKDLGGANKNVSLNTTSAVGTDTDYFANTNPTSTVFSVGAASNTNRTSEGMIAYCFRSIKGYSKIGKYTGNGQAVGGGPFIYLGFKPAFFLLKEISNADNWIIMDNKRQGYNGRNDHLFPNLANAEYASDRVELVSNGVKVIDNDGSINTSGATYIYMAFAENPFVGNDSGTAVPVTAR